MNGYVVIMIEDGEETRVGCYHNLEDAKEHLRSVRFYPQFRRSCEGLEISEDEMSGYGYDGCNHFSYHIKQDAV